MPYRLHLRLLGVEYVIFDNTYRYDQLETIVKETSQGRRGAGSVKYDLPSSVAAAMAAAALPSSSQKASLNEPSAPGTGASAPPGGQSQKRGSISGGADAPLPFLTEDQIKAGKSFFYKLSPATMVQIDKCAVMIGNMKLSRTFVLNCDGMHSACFCDVSRCIFDVSGVLLVWVAEAKILHYTRPSPVAPDRDYYRAEFKISLTHPHAYLQDNVDFSSSYHPIGVVDECVTGLWIGLDCYCFLVLIRL